MEKVKLQMARLQRKPSKQREALEGRDPEAALETASGIFGRYLGTVVRSLENRITALEEKVDRRGAPARS
jgi:hypothetical protein